MYSCLSMKWPMYGMLCFIKWRCWISNSLTLGRFYRGQSRGGQRRDLKVLWVRLYKWQKLWDKNVLYTRVGFMDIGVCIVHRWAISPSPGIYQSPFSLVREFNVFADLGFVVGTWDDLFRVELRVQLKSPASTPKETQCSLNRVIIFDMKVGVSVLGGVYIEDSNWLPVQWPSYYRKSSLWIRCVFVNFEWNMLMDKYGCASIVRFER